jgi:GNAT superfamily N-acetyltransferase
MSDYAIVDLLPSDAALNVALSRSVGWKDVESEWRVLHAAGRVRGVRSGAELLAQGVLGDYGTCATLAKMVVHPSAQRRGLGARLLDGFLAEADARGTPVGLCATDLGRPLYATRGFAISGELVILVGSASPGTSPEGSVVTLEDAEAVVRVDRQFSGCDRSRVLRARFHESVGCFGLVGARGVGLCDQRDDASVVGPILADSEAGARALATALLGRVRGQVRIDVPIEQVAFRAWLVGLGLREVSVRVEMARGAERMPWQGTHRYALAQQAWG